ASDASWLLHAHGRISEERAASIRPLSAPADRLDRLGAVDDLQDLDRVADHARDRPGTAGTAPVAAAGDVSLGIDGVGAYPGPDLAQRVDVPALPEGAALGDLLGRLDDRAGAVALGEHRVDADGHLRQHPRGRAVP